MRRIAALFALALGLGGLALATVQVDTDARALLGADAATAGALDTAEGRALTVAVIDPDRDRRSAIARQVAERLESDPIVGRVTLAPGPSGEIVDWLWLHRFALAPPQAEAFTPTALSAELQHARRALTDAAAAPLAGRYLLDPTGSFRRLIETLKSRGSPLPVYDGVPQARDDSAALLFVELQDRPFDTAEQAAFDDRLRSMITALGGEPLLVGPRSISAAISARIAERATIATVVAGVLLLLWLAVTLRSARGILASVLPAALGAAMAALVVQLMFGRVHVLALGFGGVLMGLALDYPLHLMSHVSGAEVANARRCVRIGAATTVIAFLALVLARIPAMTQVAVFVTAGLATAAGGALWIEAGLPRIHWKPAPRFLQFRMPHKIAALAAIILIGALGVALLPDKGAERLAELPPALNADIGRLDRMVDLPSGRVRIEVSARSLGELLERQRRLAGVLERARADGRIGRFQMLATVLPQAAASDGLPSPARVSELLAAPLAEAGLRPGFRADIVEAYRAAAAARRVGPADLPAQDLSAAGALIRRDGDLLLGPALLWDVGDPAALAAAVADLDDPAIRLVDRAAELARGFGRLTDRVRLGVAAGVVAALGFLLAAVRRTRAVVEIAAGCLGAALVTACLAGLVGGGLGVFHVMALALVVGIGIDYGLLLTLSGDDAQYGAAVRSVVLCATTTLIGFVTMAFSGVGVLEDMGTTVAIGVLAMLAVSMTRSGRLTGAR